MSTPHEPKPGDWFRNPREPEPVDDEPLTRADARQVLDGLAMALAPRVAALLAPNIGISPAPSLVTIAELTRMTGASRTTVHKAIQRGELKVYRVGRRIWVQAPEAR